MDRARTLAIISLFIACASACTALREEDGERGASRPSVGSITRGIRAKEVRHRYRFADAAVAPDARAATAPIPQAGTRPEDAPSEPPVEPVDAAVDAAMPATDAATMSTPPPDAATADPPREPPPEPPAEPPPEPPPMCLPATAYCDTTAQCCGALRCGNTTLGRVCCGLQREPCSRANGEDCCGQLSCDRTTLGRVCCGERGAPCATRNGEDCCRELECVAGRCT